MGEHEICLLAGNTHLLRRMYRIIMPEGLERALHEGHQLLELHLKVTRLRLFPSRCLKQSRKLAPQIRGQQVGGCFPCLCLQT